VFYVFALYKCTFTYLLTCDLLCAEREVKSCLLTYLLFDMICSTGVNSVLTHCSVASCIGSEAVPSSHVAPLLGLDYDAGQFEDDDKQVIVLVVT